MSERRYYIPILESEVQNVDGKLIVTPDGVKRARRSMSMNFRSEVPVPEHTSVSITWTSVQRTIEWGLPKERSNQRPEDWRVMAEVRI